MWHTRWRHHLTSQHALSSLFSVSRVLWAPSTWLTSSSVTMTSMTQTMIGWVVHMYTEHTFSVREQCFDWILNQVVHVNANDFFDDSVINQSLSRPELSVTVDYETPAARTEAEEDEDNYEAEVQEQFLSLDSYNIHLPKFHPQVNTNLAIR